ncbi:MAG TPA: hypothetical protein VKT81_25240 [Bryobacteraceae bacterium]|nr:hypothetical protein [Bryobacteraceae bacterium]
MTRFVPLFLIASCALVAQPPKPIHSQASSSIDFTPSANGDVVEIRNVTYDITGTNVPGRPPNDRLLLRKITRTKEVLGDIGVDANLTLETWRLGDDVRNKPLYTLTVSGDDGNVRDNAIFVVSRGLEEVEWWSVYKLGSGEHLFDTYVPLTSFSISRETVTTRYVGLDVPPDNEPDSRLKQPNVIGVLTYASESKIIREVLLTCDDRQQAKLLRSYSDVTRTLTVSEGAAQSLTLTFRQNYPSPPKPVELQIPLKGDDLDLANAHLPAKLQAAAWRR